MSKHEGRWVEIESYSGQDDLFFIQCSCGWKSGKIWSRRDIPAVKRVFKAHQGASR